MGDTHRRTLHCKAPTGSIDDITLDIYPELFVAGVDLITSGNNARLTRFEPEVNPSSIELSSTSLLDLSEQGTQCIRLSDGFTGRVQGVHPPYPSCRYLIRTCQEIYQQNRFVKEPTHKEWYQYASGQRTLITYFFG